MGGGVNIEGKRDRNVIRKDGDLLSIIKWGGGGVVERLLGGG